MNKTCVKIVGDLLDAHINDIRDFFLIHLLTSQYFNLQLSCPELSSLSLPNYEDMIVSAEPIKPNTYYTEPRASVNITQNLSGSSLVSETSLEEQTQYIIRNILDVQTGIYWKLEIYLWI